LAENTRHQKMTDRILVVTAPDDTLQDGIRIAHVNLSQEHSQLISQALLQSNLPHTIINYVWNQGDSKSWLFDKISKTNLVFFNADCDQETALLTGWISSNPRSYYFGSLRDLNIVNDRVLYNSDDILNLLEKTVKSHG
jgi:hypothetical protein